MRLHAGRLYRAPPSPPSRRWRRFSFQELLLILTIVMLVVVSAINYQALSLSETNCHPVVVNGGTQLTPPQTTTNGGDRVRATIDIKLLQSTLQNLLDSLPPPRVPDNDTSQQHDNFQQVTNLYQRQRDVKLQDVTLVTHGSVKKLPPLLDQVARWQGPISFVIYLHSHQDIYDFCVFLRDKGTKQFFRLVSIHAVLEKHGGHLPYPVNVVRNLAQRSVESNFFLLMDVDFLPSAGAYQWLVETLEHDYFWDRLRNNTVFVLPAFERFPKEPNGTTTGDMVPKNKKELKQLMDSGKMSTFHPYFPPGHMPTNYSMWFSNTIPRGGNLYFYPIEYVKRFEPYVVAYKHGIPDFWPGFRGFGYNAATWFWELDLAGFKYEVVRPHFVVHMNHAGRCERNIEDGSFAKVELRRFLRYVGRKYNLSQPELRYWKGRRYPNKHNGHLPACEREQYSQQP